MLGDPRNLGATDKTISVISKVSALTVMMLSVAGWQKNIHTSQRCSALTLQSLKSLWVTQEDTAGRNNGVLQVPHTALESQQLNYQLFCELIDVKLVVKISLGQYTYVTEIGKLQIRAPLLCPHETPLGKIHWPVTG